MYIYIYITIYIYVYKYISKFNPSGVLKPSECPVFWGCPKSGYLQVIYFMGSFPHGFNIWVLAKIVVGQSKIIVNQLYNLTPW